MKRFLVCLAAMTLAMFATGPAEAHPVASSCLTAPGDGYTYGYSFCGKQWHAGSIHRVGIVCRHKPSGAYAVRRGPWKPIKVLSIAFCPVINGKQTRVTDAWFVLA